MLLRGVFGYVLVLLGGLVTSVVPASSGVDDLPVVGALRDTVPGRMVGLTVVVAGLGLACAAWLRLVRCVGRGDRADQVERLLLVRRATLVWCAPLLLAPAMFSRDGWSYAAQGKLWALGLSPYDWHTSLLDGPIVEAVDPRWMDTPTPYGPVPLLWGSLAAMLTDDPWALVIAHRILALLGLALLAYAVPRLASWARRDAALASALVLPSPLMLAHGVAGLHNDLLMVGLMALAMVVAIERSWVIGAVLGGVAAAVKAPGGLVCIGVVLVSLPVLAGRSARLGRLLGVAALSVGTLVLLGTVSGLGMGWLNALGVPGEVRTPLSVTTQVGQVLGHLLEWLDTGATAGDTIATVRAVGSVAAVLVAAHVALRAPTGVPAAGVRAVGLVMLAVVALGPVVHHWYALWFLPLFATSALGPRRFAALLHASWLLGLVAPLDSTLRGAGPAIAVTVTLIGGIAVTQLRSHRSRAVTAPAVTETREQVAS